jgi:hypothetical protein
MFQSLLVDADVNLYVVYQDGHMDNSSERFYDFVHFSTNRFDFVESFHILLLIGAKLNGASHS